jgi:hypothetical protein
MVNFTTAPESYSWGDKTAIELFLSGAKWLGIGASAAD